MRLRAVSGKDFVIRAPLQFGEARKLAEYLCRFLHLPLADTTTDHETVVRPEKAGDNLRDRLLRGEAESERQIPPARILSKVTESSGETRIIISGPSFPLSGVLGVVAPLVFLLLVVLGFVGGSSPYPGLRGVPFLILMLILGIPAIVGGVNLMAGASRRRTIVKASPAGLAIELRGAWRTRTKVVSASEILDMDQSTFEVALKSKRNSFSTAAYPALWSGSLFQLTAILGRIELARRGRGCRSGSDAILRLTKTVGSSTATVPRRRTNADNAEAQTWKKQFRSIGPRVGLHGNELFLRSAQRQAGDDLSSPCCR